ncbi:conserved hypothetical protein [Altererythrobacter sp. B11]|uniref:PilZ domain-containing protein n=1 Tax=Altererythrobacter sp. B11 TaxID=2060312 RepID=UPI000DC6FEA1|nr:PilZ domain-containing protein [Altererythrobacter sp. B11]BBC72687.1 conserved hypothetical protein [Altererythrobacter sp. B11]
MPKPREPRKPVRIPARLKTDLGWGDADIRNVSSRGIMAVCDKPPPRGSYVELRRGSYVVIGRVAWSALDRFGLQAQDRIELDDLMKPPASGNKRTGDRRRNSRGREARAVYRPSTKERQEASIRFGRAFQFIAIAGVAGMAAVGVAYAVAGVLSQPMEAVSHALHAKPEA